VWLLDLYPKNQQTNIKPTDAKQLKGEAKWSNKTLKK
jgi:hypothetical protein